MQSWPSLVPLPFLYALQMLLLYAVSISQSWHIYWYWWFRAKENHTLGQGTQMRPTCCIYKKPCGLSLKLSSCIVWGSGMGMTSQKHWNELVFASELGSHSCPFQLCICFFWNWVYFSPKTIVLKSGQSENMWLGVNKLPNYYFCGKIGLFSLIFFFFLLKSSLL